MSLPPFTCRLLAAAAALYLIGLLCVGADTKDVTAPKIPGCSNEFQMVKVENWVNGENGETFTAMTAQFGTMLPSDKDKAVKLPVALTTPLDSCSNLTSKVFLFLFHLISYSPS